MDLLKTDVKKNIESKIEQYKYIFILSAPRSGSTLLRVSLNKIPDIVSPPETYFLEFYRYNKILDPQNYDHRILLADRWVKFRNHLNARNLYDKEKFKRRVIDHANSWRDIFNILIQLYAEDAGKILKPDSFICEKTPLHIEFQYELVELFPDAKIIYLIRDPRDVVASLKTCPWGSSNIISNAKYWCLTTSLIQDREKSILIKYEDLVDQPVSKFTKIKNFLGVSCIEDLNDSAPNEEKESVDPKNISSYKAIENGFINKWKDTLSQPDNELNIIETICFKQMQKFGYKPITSYNIRLHLLIIFQAWMEKQYKRIRQRIIK